MVLDFFPKETGGICITPRPSEPGAEILAGMPMRPFFGVQPAVVDEKVGYIFCDLWTLTYYNDRNVRFSRPLKPNQQDKGLMLLLQGKEVEEGDAYGALCMKTAWPGLARTIYGDHQRFLDTYFNVFPGRPNMELFCWIVLMQVECEIYPQTIHLLLVFLFVKFSFQIHK